MTKSFWIDAGERVVRVFAWTLLGTLTAGQTVATVHWQAALVAAGTAALGSLLTSLASIPISGGKTASLLSSSPPSGGGRHEAP